MTPREQEILRVAAELGDELELPALELEIKEFIDARKVPEAQAKLLRLLSDKGEDLGQSYIQTLRRRIGITANS